MEKTFGVDGGYNIVYFMNPEDFQSFSASGNQPQQTETNMDIEEASSTHVVQATEIIDITSILLILCTVVILLNYLANSSGEYSRDILKLYCVGYRKKRSLILYVSQVFIILLYSLVFSVILSRVAGLVLVYMTTNPSYFPDGLTGRPDLVSLIYGLIAVISISVLLLSLRKNVFFNSMDIIRSSDV